MAYGWIATGKLKNKINKIKLFKSNYVIFLDVKASKIVYNERDSSQYAIYELMVLNYLNMGPITTYGQLHTLCIILPMNVHKAILFHHAIVILSPTSRIMISITCILWSMTWKNYEVMVLTRTMLILLGLFACVQHYYRLALIFLHRQGCLLRA